MQIMINYGGNKLTLELPDDIAYDEYKYYSDGKCVNAETFRQRLAMAENNRFAVEEADLFVVNDAYRPTPTGIVLDWLEKAGKINNQTKFLISTGCHQAPKQQQLQQIFGEVYESIKDRIFAHDARDVNSMVQIGKDEFGGEVLLNRHFLKAEKVVIIGSVEPHYFAGFTGGRKSIFPGLCDYRTIVRNHELATSLKAAPMKLDGNPVDEHFRSLMRLISTDKIFSIQIVQGGKGEMATVFCGDIFESFDAAKLYSTDLFGIHTEIEYDLLLCEVQPPLDSNLYQLQKSLENCQSAVKNGGKIMLFSSCREGIGEDNFYRLADTWNPEVETQQDDDFGIHKLRRVYDIGRRIDINLFSEMPGGVPEKVFFNSVEKPQQIIDDFIKESMHVCLVRDAGHTVLINRS
jgi:nickel-dependent lactate racemase